MSIWILISHFPKFDFLLVFSKTAFFYICITYAQSSDSDVDAIDGIANVCYLITQESTGNHHWTAIKDKRKIHEFMWLFFARKSAIFNTTVCIREQRLLKLLMQGMFVNTALKCSVPFSTSKKQLFEKPGFVYYFSGGIFSFSISGDHIRHG